MALVIRLLSHSAINAISVKQEGGHLSREGGLCRTQRAWLVTHPGGGETTQAADGSKVVFIALVKASESLASVRSVF